MLKTRRVIKVADNEDEGENIAYEITKKVEGIDGTEGSQSRVYIKAPNKEDAKELFNEVWDKE